MSFSVLYFIILLFAWGSTTGVKIKNDRHPMNLSRSKKAQKHIVLLGASVGKAWNISSLPERINNYAYVFEYIHGGSSFDKSERLREIISRRENKPDAVFIKECAAYFPGELNKNKNLMKQWIKECQKEDVIPIPTTVVPVTRLHPFKQILIDILKGRNPLRFGNSFENRRNKSILEYNDWIRMNCKKCGLPVLDLEAAVRYSKENRYLREDLAGLDGLHLNSKAYKILDQIVTSTLESLSWGSKKNSNKRQRK